MMSLNFIVPTSYEDQEHLQGEMYYFARHLRNEVEHLFERIERDSERNLSDLDKRQIEQALDELGHSLVGLRFEEDDD